MLCQILNDKTVDVGKKYKLYNQNTNYHIVVFPQLFLVICPKFNNKFILRYFHFKL